MSAEDAVLTYFKKKEEKPDMVTHKFWYTGYEKKIRTPVYEAEGPEALLVTIREFSNMATSYHMLSTTIGANATYEMFRETI